jgi:DNA-binding transcriptional LysR family regulator
MEVRQLEAFLAVADHLHFGRAAQQLFMAPAPLSRTISGLENELGVRLFDRNTRTVSLTDPGRALVAPAREAVAAVARAVATVSAVVTGEIGRVRVEFTGVAAHPMVAALARGMRKHHPRIRLELASQPISRPSLDNLVEERTDIALGRFDQLPPGVTARVLRHDSLVVALPATHRLAGARTVSFAEVAHEPFVSLPYAAGSITTDRLWRLGFAHHRPVDNVQFTPDTQSCIALVSAEVGCHLALASVGRVSTTPNVVFVELAPADAAQLPDVHLRVAWRSSAPPPPVQVALEQLNLAAGLGLTADPGTGNGATDGVKQSSGTTHIASPATVQGRIRINEL